MSWEKRETKVPGEWLADGLRTENSKKPFTMLGDGDVVYWIGEARRVCGVQWAGDNERGREEYRRGEKWGCALGGRRARRREVLREGAEEGDSDGRGGNVPEDVDGLEVEQA